MAGQHQPSTLRWGTLYRADATAFAQGVKVENPTTEYLADLYTVLASVAGLPAISIPNGVDKEGTYP